MTALMSNGMPSQAVVHIIQCKRTMKVERLTVLDFSIVVLPHCTNSGSQVGHRLGILYHGSV